MKDKSYNHITSDQFKEGFLTQIKKDTWDKGLPMIYMNEERWLVKHYKNGKIIKIKKL